MANAVATISGRLGGLGGDDDEALGQSLLNFQELTGYSDLQNLAGLTRQFGVKREDIPDTLEQLGQQIRARHLNSNEFISDLRRQGPTLQNVLGLDLGEAGEFVGDISQSGVKFRAVGSGLTFAGTQAGAEDPREFASRGFEAIRNASSDAERNQIAQEYFGSDAYAGVITAVTGGAGLTDEALSTEHLAGLASIEDTLREKRTGPDIAEAARRSLRLEGGFTGFAASGAGFSDLPLIGPKVDTIIDEILIAQRRTPPPPPTVIVENSIIVGEQSIEDLRDRAATVQAARQPGP